MEMVNLQKWGYFGCDWSPSKTTIDNGLKELRLVDNTLYRHYVKMLKKRDHSNTIAVIRSIIRACISSPYHDKIITIVYNIGNRHIKDVVFYICALLYNNFCREVRAKPGLRKRADEILSKMISSQQYSLFYKHCSQNKYLYRLDLDFVESEEYWKCCYIADREKVKLRRKNDNNHRASNYISNVPATDDQSINYQKALISILDNTTDATNKLRLLRTFAFSKESYFIYEKLPLHELAFMTLIFMFSRLSFNKKKFFGAEIRTKIKERLTQKTENWFRDYLFKHVISGHFKLDINYQDMINLYKSIINPIWVTRKSKIVSFIKDTSNILLLTKARHIDEILQVIYRSTPDIRYREILLCLFVTLYGGRVIECPQIIETQMKGIINNLFCINDNGVKERIEKLQHIYEKRKYCPNISIRYNGLPLYKEMTHRYDLTKEYLPVYNEEDNNWQEELIEQIYEEPVAENVPEAIYTDITPPW